jgi:hypothetical protein
MGDEAWWTDYVARIRAAAEAHRTAPADGGTDA